MLLLLFTWLIWLTSTVYGGTVVTFAVLFPLYPRLAGRPRVELTRVYRAAGPVLGLSLGGWVLGLVGGRFVETGTIGWAWDTPAAQLDLGVWLVFAVLWFSNLVLEIWTIDPLRAAVDDATLTVTDPEAFQTGYRRGGGHLALQAALVVFWGLLHTHA
jgi:hypothetical protein